jgi:hypothetical protein
MTTYFKLVQLIQDIAKERFAFEKLEAFCANISKNEASDMLLFCGIIPEQFPHDSTEEKLWAKFCDILFSHALNLLGIETQVIRSRGDSADILGKTPDYSIVGDAKAFRLSRTAKNQKDFKVSALDDWRRSDTFACLVAPLYQYPSSKSQIYQQAQSKNVTLLSYIHLKFLLDFPPEQSIQPLWQLGTVDAVKDSYTYWIKVDTVVLSITQQTPNQLFHYKQLELQMVTQIAEESIVFWQTIIKSYFVLTKEEAIEKLIKSEKLAQKIDTIKQTIKNIRASYE